MPRTNQTNNNNENQNNSISVILIPEDIEVSSWFMKEGDVIVSIESFFQQKESYESIQALEDCSLLCIDYSQLQDIYRNFPEFNFIGPLQSTIMRCESN